MTGPGGHNAFCVRKLSFAYKLGSGNRSGLSRLLSDFWSWPAAWLRPRHANGGWVASANKTDGATVKVLDDVSLDIGRGRVTVVLGLSGTGKSTLLGLLALLIGADLAENTVRFAPDEDSDSIDYAGITAEEANSLRRDRFGFVLQSAYLLPNFSCRQNILMPLIIQEKSPQERAERLDALLDRLPRQGRSELIANLDKPAHDVSVGQRQRMAVLRALIHNPKVIFADEPSASLDPYNAEMFRELLEHYLDEGHQTMMLVTHDPREAIQLGGEAILLRRDQSPERFALDRVTADALEAKLKHSADGDIVGNEARRPHKTDDPITVQN